MKLIEQRYLPAANLYSSNPALLSILEIRDEALPPGGAGTIARRVGGWLGGLQPLRALVGLRGNTDHLPAAGLELAQLVQGVALQLQRLAGGEPIFAFVGGVPRTPGRYRLIVPCRMRQLATAALEAAVDMIMAARDGRDFSVASALAKLRKAADRRLQPAATAAPSPASAAARGQQNRRSARWDRRKTQRGVIAPPCRTPDPAQRPVPVMLAPDQVHRA